MVGTKPVVGTVSNLWKVGNEEVKKFIQPLDLFPITFIPPWCAYKSILVLDPGFFLFFYQGDSGNDQAVFFIIGVTYLLALYDLIQNRPLHKCH